MPFALDLALYRREAQRKRVRVGEEEQGGGVELSQGAFGSLRKRNGADFAPTRSSWKERKGNALASGAEEGRDKLR